ncbi:hypothetical protein PLICRDRAFT_41232 [Plicaturopsis crispa FD-325 SS-3]|nr:hypothetical protein PLICRDRAFT_41232 [Plicaturopsis crispa FD-325 SS-3]
MSFITHAHRVHIRCLRAKPTTAGSCGIPARVDVAFRVRVHDRYSCWDMWSIYLVFVFIPFLFPYLDLAPM